MNSTIKEFRYSKFLIQLMGFTLIFFAAHKYVVMSSFPTIEFYFSVWEIYGFQFITVAALIYFLNHRRKNKPEKVLTTYLILSMLKMGAVILFLLPLFLDKSIQAKPAVFSFFIAFFIFLLLETNFALKILNQKK